MRAQDLQNVNISIFINTKHSIWRSDHFSWSQTSMFGLKTWALAAKLLVLMNRTNIILIPLCWIFRNGGKVSPLPACRSASPPKTQELNWSKVPGLLFSRQYRYRYCAGKPCRPLGLPVKKRVCVRSFLSISFLFWYRYEYINVRIYCSGSRI